MFRTALKPRWLGLLLLVLAVIVAFTVLGLWQLNIARDRGQQERAAQLQSLPVAPLDEVTRPHEPLRADAVGRTVTTAGEYDAGQQLLVAGRRLADRVGYWVLTPLVVDGTGARLAVVRGFVTDPAAAPPPPAGPVELRGTLAPPESAPDEPAPLPPGQVATIDLASLVNTWDADAYTAFAFAVDETGSGGTPAALPAGLDRVPPPDPASVEFEWRNLAYALQWWLFAGFAVYMWWRMVRDDAAADRAARAVAASGPPDPAAGAAPTVTGGSPR